MITEKYKIALRKVPQLLDSTDNLESAFEHVFKNLNEIIKFDNGAIYFLNTKRLNLKFQYGANKRFDNFINIDDSVKNQLLEKNFFIFDSTSELAKEMKLNQGRSSFIICALSIRTTVFGFVVIEKVDGTFNDEDVEIFSSYSSVCAYAIKDKELMSVFKMQFKVLQEDITEKAQAYKTIEEQNKKILDADNAKNEFIANISHELRTPLNAILGFTEVLKEQFFGALNEKQMEYICDIHVSAVHLIGMINEILDISKIESNALTLNKIDLDIEPLIREVVNIISPLAKKKNIFIDTIINFESVYTGDYQKLQQILFNLLSNAIKFTPENGKIEIGAVEKDEKLRLWVKDNGIGIDPKYHGKIFGKFVQLENCGLKKESSTGLGLTITKELVKLHGGEIKIESKVNEGTKFIIELPLEEEDF